MLRKNKPKNKIIVKKHKTHPDNIPIILIYTNFRLNSKEDPFISEIPRHKCNHCDLRLLEQSKEIVDFINNVDKIEGISEVRLYRYFLCITKETAFSWNDLYPKIIAAIKKVWLWPDITKNDLQIEEKPFDRSDSKMLNEVVIKGINSFLEMIFKEL